MDLTALIGILGGILIIFLGYTDNREDEKELAHLKGLLDRGAIMVGEYNIKKKELLGI